MLVAEEAGAGAGRSGVGGVGAGDAAGDPASPGTPPARREAPQGRRRRPEGDTRWIRRDHPCRECNVVFSTQRKFDLHFSHVHLGVAPWQGEHACQDCGKVFTQKISLNVHRMFKHGAPRRYHCKKCTYEGPTKEYLKRHMKVHTDARQYVCRECGKGLKTAESFRNHMVIHTNEGRFLCKVCSKAYNHKGAYEDHVRTHRSDRDYACNYCGVTFKAYKHVARHIRAVHLNDKRFVCDLCGAQHMTGFNLKSHMKKHGDLASVAYDHRCTGCDATFRGAPGLSAHMRVAHTTVPTGGGGGGLPKERAAPEETLVMRHPTRRPVRFDYSRLSEGTLDGGRVKPEEGEEEEGVEGGGASIETIYIEEESFAAYDEKDEDVEFQVYSTSQEVLQGYASTDEVCGERVIHVYPCSVCHVMFTSESLLERHHSEAHKKQAQTQSRAK